TGRYIQPFQRVGLSHRIFPKLKTLTLDGFDILSPLASTSDQFTWVFNNIYYSLHLHDGNPCIHKVNHRKATIHKDMLRPFASPIYGQYHIDPTYYLDTASDHADSTGHDLP
ncbi:unnamed protein product, partial [Fusarium graminearum]